ncbi:helix-turn-helix domain-containing protein [Streptomyces kaniharaensis]|uniref:Helix-turn-helix domain-containing protein n=1 Tax=Streptomyces kaniharaensis TaxID=212423 RepID=A0A6N7KJM9_9ACTN|nr:helix-turn-helix transcriptional regulator [Streptomyces kaniharaensis]MQS11732.1 helix-turn-helix domain-containing protein [Streptomyces kaniharaensis]
MDSPTVLRRRLGSELRRLREGTRLQAKSVADALGFSATKVSRIESGQTTLKESDVRAMLELYGVSDEAELRQFISLTRRSTQRGWWHDYGDTLPDWFQTYVGLEADAARIRGYETELVPGLLQTADYARAMFRVSPSRLRTEEVERRVRLRIQRQEVFHRQDPPEVRVILSESVLRRPVGGPDVMRSQVKHLTALTEKSCVTIQVLPFSYGPHPSMSMAFHILSFADVPGDIVYVEALTSSLYLEKEEDIAHHELVFEQLTTAALSPEDSKAWMQELATKGYRQ